MGNGLSLSFITEAAGWAMFGSMTAAAILMQPVISSIDTDVAAIIEGSLKNYVEGLVRAEFLAKGWVPA